MPYQRGFRLPQLFRGFAAQKERQYLRLLLKSKNNALTSVKKLPELDEWNKNTAKIESQSSLWNVSRQLGKLSANDGFIVAIKDNFVTNHLPTTCASNILQGFSAPRAHVVRLMEDAGMIVVAKTNMDEFGMGSHSTHSRFGPVRNGEQDPLSAGGSSGGSALVVANSLVDCALGSDTGGSVRLPAAYNNIVGFKPSYGRISRTGLIPYANSLDTVGIFGRNTLDVLLLHFILDKYDPRDPTSLTWLSRERIENSRARRTREHRVGLISRVSSRSSPNESARLGHLASRSPGHPSPHQTRTLKRRIGVPIEYNIEELHPLVRQAWGTILDRLKAGGHEIVPISLPLTKEALSAYYVIAPAEASSNLAKYDGVRYGSPRDADRPDNAGSNGTGTLYSEHRGALFGEEVKRRILLGSYTLSASAMDNYFIQAQKVRRLVQEDFNKVFLMKHPLLPDNKVNKEEAESPKVDYIICPTAPTPPPLLREVAEQTPLDSYVNDVFTVPASLAGLPAVSIPASPQDLGGVPSSPENAVGIQIIGQFGDDVGVLLFARTNFEKTKAHEEVRRVKRRLIR